MWNGILNPIIAPEILSAKSLGDLQDAWLRNAELRRFADEDGVPWTLSYTLLASMGSFMLRIANSEQEDLTLKAGNAAPSNIYGVAARLGKNT